MKTLYVCGAFGEPYRITISDSLLKEAHEAQRALKRLPWRGEMFLSVDAVRLGVSDDTERVRHAEICIGKDHASLVVDGPEGRKSLLTPASEDLFTISDIYLSVDFYFDISNQIFSLSQGDMDLIEKWKLVHAKKFEKYAES